MILSAVLTLALGIAEETATGLARRLGFELTRASVAESFRQEALLDIEDCAQDIARYYATLRNIARGDCHCLVKDPCDACLAAHVIDLPADEMMAKEIA